MPNDSLVDKILAKHRSPKPTEEHDPEYEASLLAEKEAELDALLASEPQPEPATETMTLAERILARKKQEPK